MSLDLLVVIPAFNERRFIEGCIDSLRDNLSNKTFSYEILVVDNGSTDITSTLARNKNVDVISIERASVSRARNVGANSRTSRFIAFIDADVVITEAWGQAMTELIKSTSDTLLLTGCQYIVRKDAGWIEKFWFKNLKDKHLNGGNIIVSRSAFENIGGFDEHLKTGEDYDFCIRAQAQNVNYQTDGRFEAIHLGYPRDLTAFTKRELWHGEGDFRSLSAFLSSKVAVIGITYALASLAIVIGALLGFSEFSICMLLVLATGNIALTFLRFPKCNFETLFFNSLLNYIYFMARAMSLIKALGNKNNSY